MGITTLDGKRPDLVSISKTGSLVVWEVKTRFTRAERRDAYEKYARSADILIMAYRMATDLSLWHSPGVTPKDPMSAMLGAFLWSGTRWLLPQPPRHLNPDPEMRRHLFDRCLQLPLPFPEPPNAAASNCPSPETAGSGKSPSRAAAGVAPHAPGAFASE